MKFLRLLFNLREIYVRQTPLHIFILSLYGAIALWVVLTFGKARTGWSADLLIPVLAVAAYALLRAMVCAWIVNRQLRRYPESLLAIPSTIPSTIPAGIENSPISLELDEVDQLKPLAEFGNASLFMAVFNFYRHTKYGDYLARQAYYTVLEVPLARQLPHIIFDSKTAKGRQFKHLYLRAQQISVQGGFDDIFDTYVPQTYAVDSLSFVTPEVMEVLIAARSYDIEIIDDRLLLYAPLIGTEDFVGLVAKGREIARQLDDNIDNYRDDRLTGLERRTNVTFFGRSLLRSPTKYLALSSLFGLAIIVIIGLVIKYPANIENILLNQISLLIYVLFGTNLAQAIRILRANKKALLQYHYLYETDRGKPLKPTIT